MTTDLSKLQALLHAATERPLTALERTECDKATAAIMTMMRDSARFAGRMFATICETFAGVVMETLPAELRQQIEAIALGGNAPPEPQHSGPVSPMELLQIAHRLAVIGECNDAARLRRLADDLMARPAPTPAAGAWTEADMSKPWGAEVAFLLNLASDPALNDEQLVMLKHCAKRIQATAQHGVVRQGCGE